MCVTNWVKSAAIFLRHITPKKLKSTGKRWSHVQCNSSFLKLNVTSIIHESSCWRNPKDIRSFSYCTFAYQNLILVNLVNVSFEGLFLHFFNSLGIPRKEPATRWDEVKSAVISLSHVRWYSNDAKILDLQQSGGNASPIKWNCAPFQAQNQPRNLQHSPRNTTCFGGQDWWSEVSFGTHFSILLRWQSKWA